MKNLRILRVPVCRHNAKQSLGNRIQRRFLSGTDTNSQPLSESLGDDTSAERKKQILQRFMEKERARMEKKGLAQKLEKNLYRSPLVDPDDEEPDDILDTCFIGEPGNHKYTLVWFHGIDEDNEKAKIMLQMVGTNEIRVVVPNAPKIPLTALDEREARAWWDIEFENSQACTEDEEDTAGIRESHEAAIRILEHEEAIIGSENIIVAGFGQGASLALHTALRYPVPLKAVMIWAGYTVEQERYPDQISEANRNIKVLAYHGADDRVVRPALALEGLRSLKSHGVQIEQRVVPRMGHYIDQAQWVQGFDWCMKQFKRKP